MLAQLLFSKSFSIVRRVDNTDLQAVFFFPSTSSLLQVHVLVFLETLLWQKKWAELQADLKRASRQHLFAALDPSELLCLALVFGILNWCYIFHKTDSLLTFSGRVFCRLSPIKIELMGMNGRMPKGFDNFSWPIPGILFYATLWLFWWHFNWEFSISIIKIF